MSIRPIEINQMPHNTVV